MQRRGGEYGACASKLDVRVMCYGYQRNPTPDAICLLVVCRLRIHARRSRPQTVPRHGWRYIRPPIVLMCYEIVQAAAFVHTCDHCALMRAGESHWMRAEGGRGCGRARAIAVTCKRAHRARENSTRTGSRCAEQWACLRMGARGMRVGKVRARKARKRYRYHTQAGTQGARE